LNSLAELPTLKEFEELGRFALSENDEVSPSAPTPEAADIAPEKTEEADA
jgi:hypothetical protein